MVGGIRPIFRRGGRFFHAPGDGVRGRIRTQPGRLALIGEALVGEAHIP